MIRFFRQFILVAWLMPVSVAFSGAQLTDRQIIILTVAPDEVFGSYLFGVDGLDKVPTKSEVKVMAPVEMNVFGRGEGIGQSDLRLSTKGSLILQKVFNPGVQFTGFDFKVPANFGNATMTFEPVTEVSELSLLVPENTGVKLEADNLKSMGPMSLDQGSYMRFAINDLSPGKSVILKVSGVPLGKSLYWWSGAVFAALLLLLAGIFSWRTWPRL